MPFKHHAVDKKAAVAGGKPPQLERHGKRVTPRTWGDKCLV